MKPRRSRTLEQTIKDFWSKVNISDKDMCWEWSGSTSRRGYGHLKIRHRMTAAHRFVWEITHGSIPSGFFVCHRCDNPPCCNPDHLFLGTPQDNVDDAKSKGRIVRGTNRHSCKLTEESVRSIRCEAGSMSQVRLGKKYGVTGPLVWKILHNKIWTHIK